MVVTLWAMLAVAPGAHASTFEAPGFSTGPLLTGAGLEWVGATGLMLRQSSILPTGASGIPLTASDSRWVALRAKHGIQIGQPGGTWRQLAVLSRCQPIAPSPAAGRERVRAPESVGLVALTGAHLFAIVDPRCLRRRGYGRAAIVAVSLARGSWRLIAPAPREALALGASGERLAIATAGSVGSDGARVQPYVDVYNAHSGRLLYRVSNNSSGQMSLQRLLSLQLSIDELGDVLIGEVYSTPPPVTRASFAWWATPASPHEHELTELLTTSGGNSSEFAEGYPPATADAALAAGRIVYAMGSQWEQKLELLDLQTDSLSTVASFPGEVGVMGLDLSPREIAWAQQSRLPEGRTEAQTDGTLFECDVVALSKPQLVTVNLGALPPNGLTEGSPLPAANTPPCTEFES